MFEHTHTHRSLRLYVTKCVFSASSKRTQTQTHVRSCAAVNLCARWWYCSSAVFISSTVFTQSSRDFILYTHRQTSDPILLYTHIQQSQHHKAAVHHSTNSTNALMIYNIELSTQPEQQFNTHTVDSTVYKHSFVFFREQHKISIVRQHPITIQRVLNM